MNNENLIPNYKRTPSELREQTRKGGIASGKARREKRTLREAMTFMMTKGELSEPVKDMLRAEGLSEKDFTHTMVMTRSLIAKAEAGDVSAYNAIRDIIGEKPTDEVAVNIPNSIRVEIVGDNGKDFPSSEEEIEE